VLPILWFTGCCFLFSRLRFVIPWFFLISEPKLAYTGYSWWRSLQWLNLDLTPNCVQVFWNPKRVSQWQFPCLMMNMGWLNLCGRFLQSHFTAALVSRSVIRCKLQCIFILTGLLDDWAFLQAPQVDAESVQTVKVEVQGKVFRATAERKVMFRRYLPLTFIQTDKPIYNPGQTGELWMVLCLILSVECLLQVLIVFRCIMQ